MFTGRQVVNLVIQSRLCEIEAAGALFLHFGVLSFDPSLLLLQRTFLRTLSLSLASFSGACCSFFGLRGGDGVRGVRSCGW